MKRVVWIFGAIVAAFTSSSAGAAEYKVDPVHSSVDFEIELNGIAELTGRFREYTAVIQFDPEAIGETILSATVEVASIDTANADRDDHLQQNDFFDAAKYPHITFVSKRVEMEDENEDGEEDEDEAECVIIGDLTMHGITKEVELEFEYGGTITNRKGQEVIGFTLEGEVDRLEFGVGDDRRLDNGKLQLGMEVEFEISAEAIKAE